MTLSFIAAASRLRSSARFVGSPTPLDVCSLLSGQLEPQFAPNARRAALKGFDCNKVLHLQDAVNLAPTRVRAFGGKILRRALILHFLRELSGGRTLDCQRLHRPNHPPGGQALSVHTCKMHSQ